MEITIKRLTILSLFIFCVLTISMVGKKEGNELELAISVVNPSASDKADGIVKIDIKGGNAPYHITIETNTRTSSINAETDGHYELKNVSKGFYFLFVRDGQGNHVTKNINI